VEQHAFLDRIDEDGQRAQRSVMMP
jgi:hypothetical protein